MHPTPPRKEEEEMKRVEEIPSLCYSPSFQSGLTAFRPRGDGPRPRPPAMRSMDHDLHTTVGRLQATETRKVRFPSMPTPELDRELFPTSPLSGSAHRPTTLLPVLPTPPHSPSVLSATAEPHIVEERRTATATPLKGFVWSSEEFYHQVNGIAVPRRVGKFTSSCVQH